MTYLSAVALFLCAFTSSASASTDQSVKGLLKTIKAVAPKAVPALKAAFKGYSKGGGVQVEPIPEYCASLYVATSNCIIDVDDHDDDSTDDDDDDDDTAFDCNTPTFFAYYGETFYAQVKELNVYSAPCSIAFSDFIDCSYNEQCGNTVTFSSCPQADCKYYGNTTHT
mmetsp:Transcript_72248/g.145370  ORF Transcript_72248/g.145370 Transcript_72248/m.145370 type:complete len:168 (-) Transcript_72248:99-602(-)